jgi:peroxiredoxin
MRQGEAGIRRFICFALLLCIVPLLCGCQRVGPAPDDTARLLGQHAPDFSLKDFSGASHSLSQYSGHPIVLTFWAAWTPLSAPHLASLELLRRDNTLRENGLIILAVSVDRTRASADSPDGLRRASYPLLFDEGLAVSKQQYKVFMVPLTFLIDRQGTIAGLLYGEQDFMSPTVRAAVTTISR